MAAKHDAQGVRRGFGAGANCEGLTELRGATEFSLGDERRDFVGAASSHCLFLSLLIERLRQKRWAESEGFCEKLSP